MNKPGIRAGNCKRWRRELTFAALTFILLFIYSFVESQTIKRAEYFFDADPGKGNGISLAVSSGATINQLHSVSIGALSNGPHTFSYRVLDSNGKWSHVATRTFFIVTPVSFANATAIKRVEYFFDHDPGTGGATPLTIASGASQSNTFVLSLNGLASGFHQLAFRYQDDQGHWSQFAQRTFYIVPPVTTSPSVNITKAEYFFDHDPGVGNASSAAITPSSTENNLFTININALSSGFHQLGVRYQDDRGHWSLFANRTFYIVPSVNLSTASNIKKAEYFFDHDPGPGQATALAIPVSSSEDNNVALDISSLSSGFHQLAIRYQDNLGRWSTFANRTFYIIPGTVASSSLQKIEYFIDTDPGVNKATSLSFTSVPSVNQIFTIDLGATPPGNHVLYVRTKDNKGYWSEPAVAAPFSILSCIAPTAPLGTNASRCDAGSVTLSASGAAGSQQYRWYEDGTTSTITFTGPSFSTPTLNGNTDYYASIFDPSTGCESSRTKISALVTILPKPALNPSGSLTLCQGNNVSIVAPPGYATYDWGSGATAQQQITTSTSGSYSVKVGDGTCTSAASDPLVLTVVPRPSKPIVQTNGSTTICGSGSVTLTAPAASGYLWSDGSINQSLVASATGNFSVQIIDANNCQSDASDPIAVQVVSVPAKPVITSSGSTTLCNNSSVILSAPQNFASYKWSTGATSADLLVTSAGSYSVTVGNGTCTSVSDPMVITAGNPPAKPIIQVQGNTTICGSGSVLLTAPSAASYLWSDGSNGQQVIASGAGKYSVQITDANNCKSVFSDEVDIKVATVPSVPSVKIFGSTSLCLGTTVILAAPSGFLNYRWSNGDTTAAILISASGKYSVDVGNAPNCLSVSSLPVTITETNEPCTGGPGPDDIPPSIASASISIPVGNEITFDLKHLIKKGTVGVNFNSLRVVLSPASGAKATLKSTDSLLLDFSGNSFVGKDSVGIQVCDSVGSCTQRTLSIDVVAEVEVYNAVSPFPDNINDFFNLKYIDKIEDAKKNRVVIVDRWGNEVFSVADYNNSDKVFIGNDNNGKELPSGTYYYRIDFDSGRPTLSGFISLKR